MNRIILNSKENFLSEFHDTDQLPQKFIEGLDRPRRPLESLSVSDALADQ